MIGAPDERKGTFALDVDQCLRQYLHGLSHLEFLYDPEVPDGEKPPKEDWAEPEEAAWADIGLREELAEMCGVVEKSKKR